MSENAYRPIIDKCNGKALLLLFRLYLTWCVASYLHRKLAPIWMTNTQRLNTACFTYFYFVHVCCRLVLSLSSAKRLFHGCIQFTCNYDALIKANECLLLWYLFKSNKVLLHCFADGIDEEITWVYISIPHDHRIHDAHESKT